MMERMKTGTSGKRILALLMALALLLGVLPAGSAFAAVTEVPEGYIAINTAEELYFVRNDLSANYILMKDIDLTKKTAEGGDFDTGHGWTPIGNNEASFTGIFDGNGHTITGMRCVSSDQRIGLFSTVTGTVKNLKMKNVQLSISDATTRIYYLGGIAAVTYDGATISNCSVSGSIDDGGALYPHAGGIVGSLGNDSKISQCYFNGSVSIGSNHGYTGGIAGEETSSGKFIDCYNAGIITGGSCTGGIVGYGWNPKMNNCLNFGTVSSDNKCGAICGVSYYSGSFSYCYYLMGTAPSGCSSYSDSPSELTALTTAMSKLQGSYGGLDFDETWFLSLPSGVQHPQLQSNPEAEVVSVAVNTADAKLTYYQNEPLDLTGLTATVTFKGSSVAPIVDVTESMVSGYDPAVVGKQKVSVTYLGKTATYQVTVKPILVKSVTIEEKSVTLDRFETVSVTAKVAPDDATYPELTWTSSDPTVATVDEDGVVLALKYGKTVITAATSNGKKATCTVNVVPRATAVKLNRTSAEVYTGASFTLKTTLTPSNAADQLTWSSTDSSVASVSQDGKVVCSNPGTATITVSTSKGISATCLVTVYRSADSIICDDPEVVLNVGETWTLSARVSPNSLSDPVTWTSSDPSVVSVTETEETVRSVYEYSGWSGYYVDRYSWETTVKALKKGTTTVVATTASGKTLTIPVTVLVPAQSVTLNKTKLSLNVGDTGSLTAALKPANSTDSVSWSSDNPDVASVSKTGTVTAKMKGTATITCTADSGVTAACVVSALVPSTAVTMSDKTAFVYTGKTVQLSTSLTPAESTDTIKWTTSDAAIANVSSTGVVTGVAKGTVTITATATSGQKATCKVTVGVAATSVKLNRTSVGVNVGKTYTLKATLSPSDTTDTVTWYSDDTSVATVSKTGTVTAIAKGTATVTCTTTSGLTASCTVSVLVPSTAITLSEKATTVYVGEEYGLTAGLTPAESTDAIKWTTSDAAIATVSDSGVVTGVAKGKVTITATADSGKKATCTVEVKRHADKIALENASERMFAGDSLNLKATLTPADASEGIAWSSGNTNVATVSQDGVVTGLNPGTVTIYAETTNDLFTSCTVTVLRKAEQINCGYSALTLNAGDEYTVKAGVTPNGDNDPITWSSSNPSVVSVSGTVQYVTSEYEYYNGYYRYVDKYYWKTTLSALKNGSATITATTESGLTYSFPVTVLVPARSVTLNKTKLSLNVGGTAKLTAALKPANSTDSVTWRSGNTSVATVSKDGTVTAKAKGTATITCTASSGVSATCTVTVLVPSTAVALSSKTAFVYAGRTVRLTASLTPASSTDTVKWTSSDAKIAKVSDTGVVTGVAKGTVTVTATTTSGKTAACKVTVGVAAKSVKLNATAVNVNVNRTYQLKATLSPSDTTDVITWSSDNTAVATVSKDGKVVTKAKGTARITATAGSGASATCVVTVLVPSGSVKLSRTTAKLYVGKSFTLTATMTPKNTTDTLQWKSSNKKVVTVSAEGLVTAVAKGTATVTVTTSSGKTAVCEVTVLVPSTAVTLSAESGTIGLGETLQLTAAMKPKNTTDTVRWTSNKPGVAAVSPEGEVTGKVPGIVTITAKTTSGLTATCKIRVIKRAESITLDKEQATITILGSSITLTGTVLPEDATMKTLTWSSSNPKVAEVSDKGKVLALSEGTVIISATNAEGLLTAACQVTVISAPAGDVDADGSVTSADARLALRCSVGLEKYAVNSREFISCNVDGDEKVTSADARLILRASVGLEKLNSVSHYHVYGPEKRTEPTCTKAGSTKKTCRICGEVSSKELKPLGHDWVSQPGTKQRICSRCGKTECQINGHTWDAASCTQAAVCKVCGAKSGSALGHDWKAATCTTPKTCARCGKTEGKALGHSWKAATCTEAKVCTRCGTVDGKALGHSWKAATCTEPKTCARCGRTEGSALGHSWKAATCTEPKTCSRCGRTEGSANGHQWDNGVASGSRITYTCKVCGMTRSETNPSYQSTADRWKNWMMKNGTYSSGLYGVAQRVDDSNVLVISYMPSISRPYTINLTTDLGSGSSAMMTIMFDPNFSDPVVVLDLGALQVYYSLTPSQVTDSAYYAVSLLTYSGIANENVLQSVRKSVASGVPAALLCFQQYSKNSGMNIDVRNDLGFVNLR